MKKHKTKIIIAVVAAAVLAFVYWWGGSSPALHGWRAVSRQSAEQSDDIKKIYEGATKANKPVSPDGEPMTAEEKVELAEEMAEEMAEELKDSAPTPQPERSAAPVTKKADGAPPSKTASPQVKSEGEKGEKQCTLSVRCDTILDNIAWLDEEKVDIVPKDGVIFPEQAVTFYDGESVFNVLVREMKKNKIHLEFMMTPIYNSAYIEGIANLYEMDCGELSGWKYKVNGQFPAYGSSRYLVKDGDRIEWVYTCNLGLDVGGYSHVWQKDE